MFEKFGLSEPSELPKETSKSGQKIEIESEVKEETIALPRGSYFIHGVKHWLSKDRIGLRIPEVSASLQKDGVTKPLRPYGYILTLCKGAISTAFDRDVTSEYDERYGKKLKPQTAGQKYRHYGEDELEELIENTRVGSHNEVWVKGDMVEIAGAYIAGEELNAPGARAFLKACHKDNISVKIIKES